jgi:hypothetical protein
MPGARSPGPRRRDVERHQTLDARRVLEGNEKGGVGAPVVADDAHLAESLRVEQRQDIGRQGALGVVAAGCVRPSEPAQVRDQHAVGLCQGRDQMAPRPPVLRPAMEHDQRRPGAGLGHVEAHAVHLDIAMGDTRDRRHVCEPHPGAVGCAEAVASHAATTPSAEAGRLRPRGATRQATRWRRP